MLMLHGLAKSRNIQEMHTYYVPRIENLKAAQQVVSSNNTKRMNMTDPLGTEGYIWMDTFMDH